MYGLSGAPFVFILHMFFWKPWFIYRPKQILLRVWRSLWPPTSNTIRWVRLPWQDTIKVDVTKTIGASIWTIGLYEITVSEVLVRLICRGDVVVDAGANIGYMSVLMGRCAGAAGKLISFEPHPALFPFLEINVAEAQRRGDFAQASLRKVALSETRGEALLQMPSTFAQNEGTARLVDFEANDGEGISVATETLDDALEGITIAVMKLDVEEHEHSVLKGAAATLREKRIRHIIYEDFQGPSSYTALWLQDCGYTILRVGAKMSGPIVVPLDAPEIHGLYEPPSFLATCDPAQVIQLCNVVGWKVLHSDLRYSS